MKGEKVRNIYMDIKAVDCIDTRCTITDKNDRKELLDDINVVTSVKPLREMFFAKNQLMVSYNNATCSIYTIKMKANIPNKKNINIKYLECIEND